MLPFSVMDGRCICTSTSQLHHHKSSGFVGRVYIARRRRRYGDHLLAAAVSRHIIYTRDFMQFEINYSTSLERKDYVIKLLGAELRRRGGRRFV